MSSLERDTRAFFPDGKSVTVLVQVQANRQTVSSVGLPPGFIEDQNALAQPMKAVDESELFTLLASASIERPHRFAEEALDVLRRLYPIKGASLYTFNSHANVLSLRGQQGLDYKLYESFELPMQTIAGQALTRNEPVAVSDVRGAEGYRDRNLATAFLLRAMVAVPLTVAANTDAVVPSPLGVLCVYPTDPADSDWLAKSLQRASAFIARLYVAALETRKLSLRREFVASVAYSTDLGGLLFRALRVLREAVGVEAASVFLVDPRNGFLRMRGTTGLPDGIKKESIFFHPSSHDVTCDVLGANTPLILDDITGAFDPELPMERTESERRTAMIMPIVEASVAPGSRAQILGVMRALNKRVHHHGTSHQARFSWEDLYLARFVQEMIAVLLHFLEKGVAAEYDYERMMHGAKNNLQASIQNLEMLEGGRHRPEQGQYLISDSISFLSDIKSQILRLELRNQDELKLDKIHLYGEVLAKIPPIIQRIARAQRLGAFTVTRLEEASFANMPPVRGNRDALLCVFRNLADNATKYCKKDEQEHRIDLSWEVVNEKLVVTFGDYGIGVPPTAADLIFVEGFRADNARRRWPASPGFGLTDCRTLMRQMNGDVLFSPEPRRTTFRVEIPLWR